MALTEGAFLIPEDQNLRIARNLGDALMVVAKHLYPHQTSKHLQNEWEVDRITAKNVVQGVAGGAVVTKGVRARQKSHDDHWDMWLALGRMIFGESLAEYQERKLREIIESTENAIRLREESLARSRALDDRSAKLVALDTRVVS